MKIKCLLPALTIATAIPSMSLIACNKNQEIVEIDDILLNGASEIYLPLDSKIKTSQYDTTLMPQKITGRTYCSWSVEKEDGSAVTESEISITQEGLLIAKKCGTYNIVCKHKNSSFVKKNKLVVRNDIWNIEEKQSISETVYEINGFKSDVSETDIQESFPDGIMKFPNTSKLEAVYGFCKDSKTLIPNCITEIDMSGTGIKIIPESAFKYSTVNKITLPESLEIIEKVAFYSCQNLSSIIIPNAVEEIENAAFGYCTKLRSINIPKNIRVLGNSFVDCPINEIDVSIFETVKYDEEAGYCTNCFTDNELTGTCKVSKTATQEEWKKILFDLGIRDRTGEIAVWPENWQFEIVE